MLLHQLIPAVVTLAKRLDSVLLALPVRIRRLVSARRNGGSHLQET